MSWARLWRWFQGRSLPVSAKRQREEEGGRRVVARARFWAELREGQPGGERLDAFVEERLGRALGLAARVRLGPPGSVPRSEGKALRVVDRRPA